jgi:predicted regulator of Ras-like GTPase activity (Roadblock/LC7/MglB family)
MPYQRILDELVRSVRGAQGALLLDADGEVVVQAGARDFRHKLIGAYQGIALAVASRVSRKHGGGAVRALTCRYTAAALVLRPLKDGYYFVLSLDADASIGEAERLSDSARGRMDEAL